MGKLEIEAVIRHFSHQHPLKLVNFQPAETSNSVTCSGCKLEALGWIYSCSSCNYCLHKYCSQMPQNHNHPIDPKHTLILLSSPVYPEGAFKCNGCGRIGKGFCYHCRECQLDLHTLCAFMPQYFNHPIDPKHTLTLLSSPVYPEGAFKCNACGKLGKGFCYHCRECQLDLHTLCAFMPSSVEHNAHHHTLKLCFNPPYHNKGFRCDVCKGSGLNCWLYRCSSCEFDAHTSCAMDSISRSQPPYETQRKEQQQVVRSRSVVHPQFPKPVNDSSNWPQTQPQPTRTQSFQAQNPVSGNGLSNWNQPFDQVNCYGGVRTYVVPQYVEPPKTTNRMENDLMESMLEGLVEGFAQEAGQVAFQGILGSP